MKPVPSIDLIRSTFTYDRRPVNFRWSITVETSIRGQVASPVNLQRTATATVAFASLVIPTG